MMQSIFVKVSLGSNEYMLEEPAQMFSKLNNIENLHGSIGLFKLADISCQISAVTIPSKPSGHESGWQYDQIRSNRAEPIVEHRERPLYNSISFFLTCLFRWIFDVIDIVFGAFVI